MRKKILSCFILLIVAMIWGSAFVAQSKGMEHIGPFTYNFSRSLVGAVVLIPVAAFMRRLRKRSDVSTGSDRRSTLAGGLWCGLALFAGSTLQQLGITMTTAGKAGFITALYVIIVPILGLVLHKRVKPRIWVCAVIALAGFYLLCVRESFSVGRGDLLVLCCALGFSVHIMVIDHFVTRGADPVMMSCIQFAVTALISVPLMLIFESPSLAAVYDARLTILYAGVLSSGVAYTLQIIAQKYAAPTAAALLMSLESVFAALSGWLILGETLSPPELAGCGLVFAAVVFAQL